MKKITYVIATISLLNFSDALAQINAQGVTGTGVLTFYRNTNDKKASVIGSEYIVEEYRPARVNGGSQPFLIRFNAHNNVMEYKKDGEELILIKKDNTLVEFSNGKTYELVSYTDSKGRETDSYLSLIKNAGKVKIYKLEKVSFREARAASNTYDTATLAEYKRAEDTFFLSINGNTIELPTKSKEYIKLFPNKENEIKEFFKSNKINFKNEADLTKLAMFLNGLA